MSDISIAYTMKKKAKKKASGGTVESGDKTMNYAKGGSVEDDGPVVEKTPVQAGSAPPPQEPAQLVSQEEAEKFRKGANFAEGGSVACPSCGHQGDGMVDRAMVKKMSKGGQVANDTGEGQSAGSLPNQFDDLVLRDELEQHYTGANSGDEKGGPSKDDLVARAMLKKKAKR